MKRKVWGGKGREEEKERACINEPVVQCSLFVWAVYTVAASGQKNEMLHLYGFDQILKFQSTKAHSLCQSG